jgi:uncharacterized membrane protein YGL010W
MLFDWSFVKYRLSSHLDHFILEHQHPLNQVFHLLGVPMIILAIPAGLFYPVLGVALALGGAAMQLFGHALFEQTPPRAVSRGTLYLLAAPLWLVEKLLQPLGLSLRDLLGLVATDPAL